MATASAIATLVALAPGRVSVAIGSGFTGRMTLGQRPLSWKFVRRYALALQALLRGEATEWEGSLVRMMQPEGFGAARPIEVPIILGIGGPKGAAVAGELADGVFIAGRPVTPPGEGRACVRLTFGTVLAEGEDAGSPRAMAAAGHAAAVTFHGLYERGADMSILPGGEAWKAEIDALPPAERHIAVHDLHLIGLNARDARVVTGEMLRRAGLARTASEWRQAVAELEAAGVTEIAYQPAGPDIPEELERFMAAVR
jgi:5,10-methylenetetrahydromethanopterin reductase